MNLCNKMILKIVRETSDSLYKNTNMTSLVCCLSSFILTLFKNIKIVHLTIVD